MANIPLNAALQEALALLDSWEKSGKIPPPEELEKIDPLAAQIMRSKIFQEGKLQGREPIDNLLDLVFDIADIIKFMINNPEELGWQVDHAFDDLYKAFCMAAKIFLICHGYRRDKRRPKKPLKLANKLASDLVNMRAAAKTELESPPQPKGDLADRVSEILMSHCPKAKPYTIAHSTEQLLKELSHHKKLMAPNELVFHFQAERLIKRMERKAKPKTR